MFKLTPQVKRNVVANLVNTKSGGSVGQHLATITKPNITGTYHYTSKDFKGQDYVSNENIISGEFIVPIMNSNHESKGWLSWQNLAYPTGEPNMSVQESVTISFGNKNNDNTYHGSALSVAKGGYYDEGTPYKFSVSNGKGDKAVITITNVGNGVRSMVVSRASDTYHYTSKDFKGQDYVSNENIISGEFIVPLVNSDNESQGWVSWQDLAYPTSESKWPVQESVTISFGNNNNATTYHGSALNVATGGFYDEGTPYKFCVSDGKGGNAIITITNVGNGVRNLVFERAK